MKLWSIFDKSIAVMMAILLLFDINMDLPGILESMEFAYILYFIIRWVMFPAASYLRKK